MPALRESLISPPPGASALRPTWVQPEDLAGCVACDTQVDLAEVCGAVSEWLYVLSGRRYKQRRAVIRPTLRVPSPGAWQLGYVGGWQWVTGGWEWVRLPGHFELQLSGPVQEVVTVMLDGVALQPGDITLYDGRYLVRTSGAAWPEEQDLSLADTEPGTFSVNYVWGQLIPIGGRLAARAWACYLAGELAKLGGEGECALPSRVTQLVRQGTTLSRLSALDFLQEGLTGIELVDQWVRIENPSGRRRPATIASPDTMRGARQA